MCTRQGTTFLLLDGSLDAAERILAIVAGLLMIAMALQFFGALHVFHRLAVGFGSSTFAMSLRSLLDDPQPHGTARLWRPQRIPVVSAGLCLCG